MTQSRDLKFPENKSFAFSIFDDTDGGTPENVGPVYDFLSDIGILVTKSVWPLSEVHGARIGGSTLEDDNYCRFIISLKMKRFEIALHNVRNHDSTRDVILKGLEQFRQLLGHYPQIHCNHSMNRENIYWGSSRLSDSKLRFCYNLATKFSHHSCFQGHVQNTPYFWGDICKERITYVRNLVFNEINLRRINPTMPYHDPSKPFVNFWFSSSEGGNVDTFCKLLAEDNQDQLQAEGGVCIMYTHFASGFYRDGALHPAFVRLMRRLSKMNGWFVPVSTLLDYLRKYNGSEVIPKRELSMMERRWFLTKLRTGTT